MNGTVSEETINHKVACSLIGNNFPSRPTLERGLRIQNEIINDLIVELFCQNQYHVFFDKISKEQYKKLNNERIRRNIFEPNNRGHIPEHLKK
jgi:hypothetical protein